jgi:hypothetical protein
VEHEYIHTVNLLKYALFTLIQLYGSSPAQVLFTLNYNDNIFFFIGLTLITNKPTETQNNTAYKVHNNFVSVSRYQLQSHRP